MCGYPDLQHWFLDPERALPRERAGTAERFMIGRDWPTLPYSHRNQHWVNIAKLLVGTGKGLASLMSLELTSQEALQLAAALACTADRLRAAGEASEVRQKICQTASRIAFLRAHLIASREELFPPPGDALQPAIFAAVS